MDGIASVSGVGAVASRVSFTASTSTGETSGTDVQGDVNTLALKLIQAVVANSPTGVQHLDVKA